MSRSRFLRPQVVTALAALFLVADGLIAHAFGSEWFASGLLADGLAGGGASLALVWFAGHCDGMDGPVVTLAKKALESGKPNLVLPWVRAEDEPEIRAAFDHAVSVRALGPRARELADRHFFETLVRVHRAAEGAPYTGLKPAGRDLGPAIPRADKAIEDGSIESVIDLLTDAVRDGVRRHFHAVASQRDFDVDDVAAGRRYVEAYVPYIHYVERLWRAATSGVQGHHAAGHVHDD